jgi:hypothetical protein
MPALPPLLVGRRHVLPEILTKRASARLRSLIACEGKALRHGIRQIAILSQVVLIQILPYPAVDSRAE